MTKKLILFDIDGTLILTGGVAASLMVKSVSQVLNRPVQWNIRDFVGYTDRYILQTLLQRCGTSESFLDDFTEEALSIYLKGLSHELSQDGIIRVLPGVQKLVHAFSQDPRFALGLVTGNVRDGAAKKLNPVGLFKYFPVGAFGDDGMLREKLPPIAIQRAENHFHCFFEKKDIWIVGDSANDIYCAHSNHIRCLAVGTGHYKEEELREHNPDAYLEDLSDSQKVVNIIYPDGETE
jgi:phosphoglycolate phosphatase